MPHEVPPGQGGAPANGTPPFMPYFLPAYPPYSSPYGPGHMAMYPGPIPPMQQLQPPQHPQPQAMQPQQTIQQVSLVEGPPAKKEEEACPADGSRESAIGSGSGTTGTPKRRTHGSIRGGAKAKKAKLSHMAKDKGERTGVSRRCPHSNAE